MEKRLELFLKSVTDYADAQCKKLEKTAETQMQKEITTYKKQATEQSRINTSAEIGRIQSEKANKASAHEAEKRLMLSRIRNELSDSVFDDVTDKIKDFTKSDEYRDFLKRSAKALKEVIGENIIYGIRPCDMPFAPILLEIAENAKVCEDPKIILGGLTATDENGEVRADDTLDSRLMTEKKAFFENADFKIF